MSCGRFPVLRSIEVFRVRSLRSRPKLNASDRGGPREENARPRPNKKKSRAQALLIARRMSSSLDSCWLISRRQRVSAPRTASLPRLGPHVGAGLAAGFPSTRTSITLAYRRHAVINFPRNGRDCFCPRARRGRFASVAFPTSLPARWACLLELHYRLWQAGCTAVKCCNHRAHPCKTHRSGPRRLPLCLPGRSAFSGLRRGPAPIPKR